MWDVAIGEQRHPPPFQLLLRHWRPAYTPGMADWVRAVQAWLAVEGNADLQGLALHHAVILSNTLAAMGRGDTSWPGKLYDALRAAGLIRIVSELNAVQEAYSKLVEWIKNMGDAHQHR
jgi:hypothetical protein